MPDKKPPQPNATRWSSTYNMVNGMVKVRPSFEGTMTVAMWELTTELAKGLYPLYDLTTRLQGVQYIVGDLYRDLVICQTQLAGMEGSVASLLLEKLRIRKNMLLDPDNLPVQAALFMDPRFHNNKSTIFTAEQKKRIIGYLLVLKKRIDNLKGRDVHEPDQDVQIQDVPNRKLTRDEMFKIGLSGEKQPSLSQPIAPKTLAQRLIELEMVDEPHPSLNVQSYWRGKLASDEELAELVNVVLALPASQVSVERAFSSLPLIFTTKRSQLGDDNLETQLFVTLNRSLIEQPDQDININ